MAESVGKLKVLEQLYIQPLANLVVKINVPDEISLLVKWLQIYTWINFCIEIKIGLKIFLNESCTDIIKLWRQIQLILIIIIIQSSQYIIVLILH